MTLNKISSFLTSLNYNLDMELPLKEVSAIYLTTDGYLYPDEKTRIKFKKVGTSGVIEVYEGKEKDGKFIKDSDKPKEFIAFEAIGGFILKTPTTPGKSYLVGRSL